MRVVATAATTAAATGDIINGILVVVEVIASVIIAMIINVIYFSSIVIIGADITDITANTTVICISRSTNITVGGGAAVMIIGITIVAAMVIISFNLFVADDCIIDTIIHTIIIP